MGVSLHMGLVGLRILFVSYFPRVNGVSTSIHTFTRALEQLDHEVHLITSNYVEHQPGTRPSHSPTAGRLS